ncbi:MAG: SMP-30/gluconolactonase/LRE family protein, partial [Nevskiales bacterium]
NYTFIDGVLLEAGGDGREQSVLVTETVKFRILRLHLNGERAARDEVLWESLPGLPDGIDRDPQGRIWVGLVKTRSRVATWAHQHPWIKGLLLRLPHALLPVPPQTGLMALSPDASRVLFYSIHDGSRINDISVVTPGSDVLFPANFDLAQRGFHRLAYPPEK